MFAQDFSETYAFFQNSIKVAAELDASAVVESIVPCIEQLANDQSQQVRAALATTVGELVLIQKTGAFEYERFDSNRIGTRAKGIYFEKTDQGHIYWFMPSCVCVCVSLFFSSSKGHVCVIPLRRPRRVAR